MSRAFGESLGTGTLTPNAYGILKDLSLGSDQSLSIPAYLDAAVMGVLTEGLEDLCRQRPANPVDHLALFLLRRSQSSAVTEVSAKDAVPVQPTATE